MSMEYYVVFKLHDDRVRIVRVPPEIHFDLRETAEDIIKRVEEEWRDFARQIELLEELPYVYPDGKENHDLSLLGTFSDLRYYSTKDVKEILEQVPLEAWLAVSKMFGQLDDVFEAFWFYKQIPISYKEAFKINEEDIEVVDHYTVRINKDGEWKEYKIQGVGMIWT